MPEDHSRRLATMSDHSDLEAALAHHLLQAGLLDQAGLIRAQRLQEGSNDRLNLVLTRLALVTERDMAGAIAAVLGERLLNEADYPSEPPIERPLGVRFLKEMRVVPIAEVDGCLVLAMADPLDTYASHAIRMRLGCEVIPRVGVPADIEAAIDRWYAAGKSAVGQLVEDISEGDDGATEDVERLRDLAAEAPVIRLVNALIARAVEMRANDIHLEPRENALRIRYRIDGVLREVEGPPAKLKAAVLSRVKIMAKLNIAERRLPQDGRIRLTVRGKEIDLRVSTLPALHGESVVIRILDRGRIALDLPTLGYEGAPQERLLELLGRPNGIVLVTGPVAHGKTTTLYAALKRLNTGERKIITVEDPIEYQLEGITQVQVKAEIGLTFAHVLRAMLRQNPDILLIGEMRDRETAEIGMQASLTGQLVLSTLHTNSAAASVTRLIDMGIEPYLLIATVNGIVGQRLVRRLCETYAESYVPAPEVVRRLGLERAAHGAPMLLRRPVGCPSCGGSGFHGRTTISEVLVMSDDIRRLVLRDVDTAAIGRAAVAEGMTTMYLDGMKKALAGEVTPDEVLAVTRDA